MQNLLKAQPGLKTKHYLISQLDLNVGLNVIGLDFIKQFLKIQSTDTTHDATLLLFRKTAIEYAQKQLQITISPVKYKMNISSQKIITTPQQSLYYSLYKNGLFNGVLNLFEKRQITTDLSTFQSYGIYIPIKPLLEITNLKIDEVVENKSDIYCDNLNGGVFSKNLNLDFNEASIEFISGYQTSDDVPADITTAILNHIYFMWVDNDFSTFVPKSSIEIYKNYSQRDIVYRV
jgi:hypothetical protein